MLHINILPLAGQTYIEKMVVQNSYIRGMRKCGEQDTIERMVTAKYEGDYTDNFICENCGNNQEVVIKIERINDNVKADYETTQNGKTSDENRVSFGEYSFVLPDNWGYDKSSKCSMKTTITV